MGTRLGELLVQAGGDVVGLRRTPPQEPGAFPVLPAELRNPLPEELPRADALVIALTPSGLAELEAEDGYRAALEHLAAALPHPPESAIFVSSTRVFEGWTDARAVTEADEPAPASPRARSLLRGEALAVELFGAQVVRPAGIYGPGRDMLLRKVLDAAPVDHARRTNRIHEVDLAALLQAMLGDPAAPRLVHAVDRAPGRPLGEVVAYLADRLGLPTPPHADPERGGGSEYDGARALALLGALRYPTFREGYAEIVDGR
ncbi:sugar nucleotide-binding protein [Rothia sp. AR01]|uniref:Sugar nucleotide-binding protein n=1 Tax=Rothia santali TaxID=2949643 RepID=A0A9X2HF21_9MICC|nr:sugar nucleotide-binding protein [Rothia santali]MCP3426920.1 sugar nucleotide-binding protein [Rothia santali]